MQEIQASGARKQKLSRAGMHIEMCGGHIKTCGMIFVTQGRADYGIFNIQKKLGQAGLSVMDFAGLMQINCNSVSNYSSKGYVPVHLAVAATLMSEMAYRDIDFKSILLRSIRQDLRVEPLARKELT
ncbi:hypothetical protein ACRS5L_22410 [Metapseudomonas otitidis]|uniref:hypothetical protein n=1 Tax=Metapseudomonas otitidis TaxID=319939 RepID=UPI003EE23F80